MKVTLLGLDCLNCVKLREMLNKLITEHDIVVDLEEINDTAKIIQFQNVRMVPCLLVDGVMKLQGRVPTEEELSELLGVKKKD